MPAVKNWSAPSQVAIEDPFRLGTNQAMNAAELTQTAEFREDWSRVAILWQQAIKHMQSVPQTHSNYAIAQEKLGEYTRNLQYAQNNISSKAPNNPSAQPYWTLGSDRELVIALQGMPRRVNQYDTTSCKEILYYGDSAIELNNGYVIDYSDLDGNLAVLADDQVALSLKANNGAWTIGSSQQEVFDIQGTPTRTSTYKESMTLHYEGSFVKIQEGQVVGYSNVDNNLKVSLVPTTPSEQSATPSTWSFGSSRSEVLRVEQRTPTAVSRFDNSCEEIFTFDNSTIKFRKGLVSEYSNTSGNLQIQ